MLEKQKKKTLTCISTLLVEFDDEKNHFPQSMSKHILNKEQKSIKTGIY